MFKSSYLTVVISSAAAPQTIYNFAAVSPTFFHFIKFFLSSKHRTFSGTLNSALCLPPVTIPQHTISAVFVYISLLQLFIFPVFFWHWHSSSRNGPVNVLLPSFPNGLLSFAEFFCHSCQGVANLKTLGILINTFKTC